MGGWGWHAKCFYGDTLVSIPSFSLVSLFLILFSCAGSGQASQVIPFDYCDGLIWVKVTAAGRTQPLDFVLDSGADCTVLDTATVRRLGLSCGARQSVQCVSAAASARHVRGFQAAVGGIALKAAPLALDLSATSALCSRRIDGLIGSEFFRDRVVQIDFKARRIRLLDTSDSRGCCASVSLRVRNRALCVPVSVNGSEPRWTRLDTGCDGGLHWVNGKGGQDSRATVVVGAESIEGAPVVLHRSEFFPSEAGLLGNEILSNYRVTIDSVRGVLLLQES